MRSLVIGALVASVVLRAAPAVAADAPPAAPSPAERVAQLKEALAGDDEEAVVEALEAAHGADDKALVAEVRKALKSRERAVRHAAVNALGHMPSDAALDALHAYLRDEKALADDEELFALTLREIGRHADKRSVAVLLDDPFRWLTVASGTARLMALANIRTPETVEGLIATGKKTGSGGGMRGTQNEVIAQLRPAFRVAMVVLTGHDEGPGAGLAWAKWWKDEGKKAGVPATRPPVPAEIRAFWEGFWKEPYGVEAAKPGGEGPPMTIVPTPTPEQVAEAVAGLKAAFDTSAKDDESRTEALQRFGGVLDKAVVHEVAKGLTSRSTRVRWVTIDVLGWSGYPPALKQLHRLVAREPNLAKDDEALFAHLLKAIGRHGDASSIEVLSDKPLRGLTFASGRARILGLARIREKQSVEELMRGMTLVGERPRRRGGDAVVPRFLQDFRVALTILTGQELGSSKEAWLSWWRKAEKTFKMSPTPPPLQARDRATWEEFWGEPYPPRVSR